MKTKTEIELELSCWDDRLAAVIAANEARRTRLPGYPLHGRDDGIMLRMLIDRAVAYTVTKALRSVFEGKSEVEIRVELRSWEVKRDELEAIEASPQAEARPIPIRAGRMAQALATVDALQWVLGDSDEIEWAPTSLT